MEQVVVIGGGQAGLALGYHLARRGRAFTILDAGSEPAAAWRARWNSLRLFTPARYSGLPSRPFPGDPDHYPTRDEVAEYLTGYARDFELPVELDRRVHRLTRADGRYRIDAGAHVYEAAQVVVATGPFQTPRVPPLARGLDPAVTQLHSSEYRSPEQLPDGRVLVVGGGNSGYQIAEELGATHEVHLAVGSHQAPLPQRLLGRDLFWYLTATGLINTTVSSRLGRKLKDRETLIGSSPRALRRRFGVTIRPRATSASGARVTFADGSALDPAAVVWATGFTLDHTWIDAPVFASDGAVRQARGVTASPGLYFLGLPWMHTRGSALIGFVGDDARHIAQHISAAGTSTSHTPELQEVPS